MSKTLEEIAERCARDTLFLISKENYAADVQIATPLIESAIREGVREELEGRITARKLEWLEDLRCDIRVATMHRSGEYEDCSITVLRILDKRIAALQPLPDAPLRGENARGEDK